VISNAAPLTTLVPFLTFAALGCQQPPSDDEGGAAGSTETDDDALKAAGAPNNVKAVAEEMALGRIAGIKVQWQYPARADTQFIVERSTDKRTWQRVALTGHREFSDTTVARGTTHHYRVLATDTGAPSKWSSSAGTVLPVAKGLAKAINDVDLRGHSISSSPGRKSAGPTSRDV
jgi:hypothetical protein